MQVSDRLSLSFPTLLRLTMPARLNTQEDYAPVVAIIIEQSGRRDSAVSQVKYELSSTQWRKFGLKSGGQARGVLIKWGSVPHSKNWGSVPVPPEITPNQVINSQLHNT